MRSKRSSASREPLANVGIRFLAADITQPASLAGLSIPMIGLSIWFRRAGRGRGYRDVYLDGTRNVLLALEAPPRSLSIPAAPAFTRRPMDLSSRKAVPRNPTETAKLLLDTEKALMDAVTERRLPR